MLPCLGSQGSHRRRQPKQMFEDGGARLTREARRHAGEPEQLPACDLSILRRRYCRQQGLGSGAGTGQGDRVCNNWDWDWDGWATGCVFFGGGGHNQIVKVNIRPAQVQSRRISSVKHALSHCPSARPVGWLAPYPAAQIAGCAGASGHGVPWRASAPRELGPGLQKRGGGTAFKCVPSLRCSSRCRHGAAVRTCSLSRHAA